MAKTKSASISDFIQERQVSSLGSSDAVAKAVLGIEKLIVDRHFTPGQRLVEADLARTLGIARGPIREALRILAGDRVIELIPNRGAQIRIINNAQLIEMAQVIGRLFCIGIDFFTARAQGDRPLAALTTLAKQIKQAAKINNVRALWVCAIEYHQVIFHYSGNSYLSYLLQRVHLSHYLAPLDTRIDRRFLTSVAQGYLQMTAAISASDAEGAKNILLAQMDQIVAQVNSNSGTPIFDQAVDFLVQKADVRKGKNISRQRHSQRVKRT